MTDLSEYGWAAQVAAEIAAEKRPKAEGMSVVNVLKAEIVRARLALAGVTDPKHVAAIVSRTAVAEDGTLIGLHANGSRGVGSGPNFTMTVEDVVAEVDAKSLTSPKAANAEHNPFAKGANFNITEQMIVRRTDPAKADHLEYLAALGRNT